MGSQYANQTGVVATFFGNAGPREVAVRLDIGGRTEFFARRYLRKLVELAIQQAPMHKAAPPPMTILKMLKQVPLLAGAPRTQSKESSRNVPDANLPASWMELRPGHPRYDSAEGGRIYYYNMVTERVQFEHPRAAAERTEAITTHGQLTQHRRSSLDDAGGRRQLVI